MLKNGKKITKEYEDQHSAQACHFVVNAISVGHLNTAILLNPASSYLAFLKR